MPVTTWIYQNEPTAPDRLKKFCDRLKTFLPLHGNINGLVLYKYPSPVNPSQNILMGYRWEVFKTGQTFNLRHDLIAFSSMESCKQWFPLGFNDITVYIGGDYGAVTNKLISCSHAAAPLWPFVPVKLIIKALANPDTLQSETINQGTQQPRTYTSNNVSVPFPVDNGNGGNGGNGGNQPPKPLFIPGPVKPVNKFLTIKNVMFIATGLFLAFTLTKTHKNGT